MIDTGAARPTVMKDYEVVFKVIMPAHDISQARAISRVAAHEIRKLASGFDVRVITIQEVEDEVILKEVIN